MIKGGYMGKMLRVDLTSGSAIAEDLPSENVLRGFVGGTGLGAKYLFDEVAPSVNALDPESRLLLMAGPLSGTMWPGSSRYCAISLHGDIPKMSGTSWGGGFWAAKLKWAGFDGVILQGRSERPVYLHIHDGVAELRDAGNVWGKDTYDTETLLRREVRDPQASIACIGPAGERCLPGSILKSDYNHVAGKSGAGQIMGSKQLKAIVISGSGQGVPLADASRFMELALEYRQLLVTGGRREFRRGGWAPKYDLFARQWRVIVKNLADEGFQHAWAQEVVDTCKVSKIIPRPCFNCPIGCSQDIIIGKGPYKGYRTRLGGGAQHMEGIGGNIGVLEGGTVLYLTDLMDRLGIDAANLGQMVGLCYECYEKGMIDKSFTDGLELKWGNADAAIKLIYKYLNQEGIGKLFAEGQKALAKAIGKGADQFLSGYKGTAHAHDNRHGYETTLGLAVAGAGAAIEGVGVDIYPEADIGWVEPQRPFDKDRAPKSVRMTQLKNRWDNSIGLCTFTLLGVPRAFNYYTPEAVNLAVGWDFDRDEALEMGERVVNLMRVFNLKRGLTFEDDLDVGPRMLEGLKVGPLKGHPIGPHIGDMIKEYYALMGWDRETGIPTDQTLTRLALGGLVNDVRKLRRAAGGSGARARRGRKNAK